MVAINFTTLVDKVRSGEKQQTIRLAKCYDKGCDNYPKGVRIMPEFVGEEVSGVKIIDLPKKGGVHVCDGCKSPKLRYREGMKVQLYMGLRTKHVKKLGEGVITEVKVIGWSDITEELAVADGFEQGYQEGVCERLDCYALGSHLSDRKRCDYRAQVYCKPEDKLRLFLHKAYSNPETLKYAVIRWRLEK